MTISVFDLFKIGIGPSSSHTVGPMRAAGMFARSPAELPGGAGRVARVRAELFGSLGATGHGHGSVPAVVLGLAGEVPETVDPAAAGPRVTAVGETGRLRLASGHEIPFDPAGDIVLHRRRRLDFHSNGMRFTATDQVGHEVSVRTYYSVGGGFVLGEDEAGAARLVPDQTPVPYPFGNAAELLAHTAATGLPISGVMLANERAWRSDAEITGGLLRIWQVMQECVHRGCEADGVLPGGLRVRRRARDVIEC